MAEDRGQALADQGFEVYERAGGDLIIDVPNPRVADDDYFFTGVEGDGYNPHRDVNRDETLLQDGESTADAQQRQGGAGWNQQAGAIGDTSGASGQRSAEPDETWKKAELEQEAQRRNIDVPSDATKADIIAKLRS